ncbi:MAG: hypothetical protein ABIR92_02455 [Gemmatimonadaceae bacterium]
MRTIDLLHQLSDDLGAGGVRQLGQLLEMLVGRAPRPNSLARRADQNRPFNGRIDVDQCLTD